MGTGPLAAAVAGVTVKREADAPLARVSESVPLVLHLAQVASSGTQHGEKATWATHQIAERAISVAMIDHHIVLATSVATRSHRQLLGC